MVSAKTLKALEDSGHEYVVGVRMRKLKIASEVLSRAGRYKKVADNLQDKEVVHDGVRYVVCLNPEEVERDAKVREAIDYASVSRDLSRVKAVRLTLEGANAPS